MERQMMRAFRRLLIKKAYPQAGQGMVEFALVLPILLLVMFGIFAFSHLLFSYTLVTAASREAARFGVATGLSDTSIPRFRDCGAIRAAAVRVGAFAGVQPENVTITYDQGPHADGSPADVYPNDCPVDGIGPGYIEIGDRIVVTIDVDYQPITPLNIVPSLNLTGETRRTIIRSLPIGDAPVAPASQCVGTITRVIPPKGQVVSTSKYGQPFDFIAEVIADDLSNIDDGTLRIWLDHADYVYEEALVTGAPPAQPYSSDPVLAVGPHQLRAEYNPGGAALGSPCYNSSRAEPWNHTVVPAETIISGLSEADTKKNLPWRPIKIYVEVDRDPNSQYVAPKGPVVLYELVDGDLLPIYKFVDQKPQPIPHIMVANDPFVLSKVGKAWATAEVSFDSVGKHEIVAIYDPGELDQDPNFNQSPPRSLMIDVEPFDTYTSIISAEPDVKYPGGMVTVTVEVRAMEFDPGAPVGAVILTNMTTKTDYGPVDLTPYSPETGLARASFQMRLASVGEYFLSAAYYPASSYFSASATTVQFPVYVGPLPTEMTLSVDPALVEVGQTITVNADVISTRSGVGTPAGTIKLVDAYNDVVLDSLSVNEVSPGAARASFLVSFSGAGGHILQAIFEPADNRFASSSAELLVVVEPAATPDPG